MYFPYPQDGNGHNLPTTGLLSRLFGEMEKRVNEERSDESGGLC